MKNLKKVHFGIDGVKFYPTTKDAPEFARSEWSGSLNGFKCFDKNDKLVCLKTVDGAFKNCVVWVRFEDV